MENLGNKKSVFKILPFGNIAEAFSLSQVFVLPSFNLVDVDTHSRNPICQQNSHLNGIKVLQLLHNQI